MTTPTYGVHHRARVLRAGAITGTYDVEIPLLAPGLSSGPLPSTVPNLVEDDQVLLAQVGTTRDDLIIIGKLPPAIPVALPITIGDVTGLSTALDGRATDAELAATNANVATNTANIASNTTAIAGKQPLDSDLTTIAGLTPAADNVLQFKSGAWTSRTMAQLLTDVGAQPLDADLTTIAGLTAATDSFLQAKAGAWSARTIAQVKTDLAITNGYMGQDVVTGAAVTSSSTTEQLINSVTFTAVAGRRYRFVWSSSMGGTVVNDLVQFRVRWATGATVTSAGTLVHSRFMRILVANTAHLGQLQRSISGLTAGQVTLGVFGFRSAGTGTITWDGSTDSERVLLVEDIGT